MNDLPQAGVPAPPVPSAWQMAGSAYALIGLNFGPLITIIWPWAILSLAFRYVLGPLTEAEGDFRNGFLLGALTMVWQSGFLLRWYRFLDGNWRPSGPRDLIPDAHDVRFFATFAAIQLLVLAPLLAGAGYVWLSGSAGTPTALGPGAVAMFLALAVLIASLRLTLMLPAIAAGDRRVDVATAWKLTRNCYWRLAFAILIASLPAVALDLALPAMSTFQTTGVGFAIVAADELGTWLSLIAMSTVVSVAYGHLVQNRPV